VAELDRGGSDVYSRVAVGRGFGGVDADLGRLRFLVEYAGTREFVFEAVEKVGVGKSVASLAALGVIANPAGDRLVPDAHEQIRARVLPFRFPPDVSELQ